MPPFSPHQAPPPFPPREKKKLIVHGPWCSFYWGTQRLYPDEGGEPAVDSAAGKTLIRCWHRLHVDQLKTHDFIPLIAPHVDDESRTFPNRWGRNQGARRRRTRSVGVAYDVDGMLAACALVSALAQENVDMCPHRRSHGRLRCIVCQSSLVRLSIFFFSRQFFSTRGRHEIAPKKIWEFAERHPVATAALTLTAAGGGVGLYRHSLKPIDVAYFVADTSYDDEVFKKAMKELRKLISNGLTYPRRPSQRRCTTSASVFRKRKQRLLDHKDSYDSETPIFLREFLERGEIENEPEHFRWVNGKPQNNSEGVLVQVYDVHPDRVDHIEQVLKSPAGATF